MLRDPRRPSADRPFPTTPAAGGLAAALSSSAAEPRPLFEMRHFTVCNRKARGIDTTPDGVIASLRNVRLSP